MVVKVTLKNRDIFSDESNEVTLDKSLTLAYGLNGTGKTTLSSFLYKECVLKDMDVDGVTGFRGKRVLVFNRDFVKDNFYDVDKQRGIFGLSEKEMFEKTEALKDAEDKRAGKERELSGQESRVAKQKLVLEDCILNCFIDEERELHDSSKVRRSGMHSAILGRRIQRSLSYYMGDKEEWIEILDRTPMPAAKPGYYWYQLAQEANDLRRARGELNKRASIGFSAIKKIEADPIWGKTIQGKDSSPFAEIISDLENADWVKEGMKHLSESKGTHPCPFCQQDMAQAIARGMKDYFDAQYEKDVQKIKKLTNEYASARESLAKILSRNEEYFEYETLFREASEVRSQVEYILAVMESNLHGMKEKMASPSKIASITFTGEEQGKYQVASDVLNSLIAELNAKIRDRGVAREDIREKLWPLMKWTFERRDSALSARASMREEQDKANAIRQELADIDSHIKQLNVDISALRKQRRGIENAADKINDRLSDIGITNFHLEVEGEHYVLRRLGGQSGRTFDSLSEGEKTVICFLYFMALCAGRGSADKVRQDQQIIVIDDPITSMSHQHVFNVSQMIYRQLVKDNTKNKVFVLTHSLYFFYELKKIVGDDDGENIAMYRFFKNHDMAQNPLSCIVKMDGDEIANEYQSYWQVFRDSRNNKVLDVMVANTMRNIVEYYFGLVLNKNSLSGVLAKILKEGDTKAEAFKRYINRESHSDMKNHTFDSKESELWREYFEQVFEKNGHIEHYNAMMRPRHPSPNAKK